MVPIRVFERGARLSNPKILRLFLPLICIHLSAAPFDAAPFALPLPEGNGLMWEDPREIHKVILAFNGSVPAPEKIRLEYWGSRWPGQHLPKDREPGGADVGWMELGNWYQGGWRPADAEATREGSTLTFTFKPVNAKEFPNLKGYSATFRYTLKLRVQSDTPLTGLKQINAFTDSQLEPLGNIRLAWNKPPAANLQFTAFNGAITASITGSIADSRFATRLSLHGTLNSDPNTFDRTLVTVRNGDDTFTFAVDDLKPGDLFLPQYGVAILPETDSRDYAAAAAAQRARGAKTLYDKIAEMPEQTWQAAWAGLPRKKSDIYLPLGLDGGRERFRLEPDGSIRFRSNDHYLKSRAGNDTPRLALEPPNSRFRFGPLPRPSFRTLEDTCLPICHTTWVTNGLRIQQTAFVTDLAGTKATGPVPAADAFAVFLARFTFTNETQAPLSATLPIQYRAGESSRPLRADENGLLWLGDNVRGQLIADKSFPLGTPSTESPSSPVGTRSTASPSSPVRTPSTTSPSPAADGENLALTWNLAPGESKSVVLKIPYVVLTQKTEHAALTNLSFDIEQKAVATYWRRRLDESARLLTPEPMLNEFYRAHAGHLLINCEHEPNSARRFARVGSFGYGAYGNESCMMVVDLDRRGYHHEAQECLDAWLHYQGTVALPGDFASKDGVLYGAGGYEAGGYNQHHGWILWCLAEHYRFTRDEAWLRRAAPGIVKGADWIIQETGRTANRHELERGLLPAGSLEDIGDWWTWLSTSCYTWRGLDSAAWALEQLRHPEAKRIRQEAATFRTHLLANFRAASARSPVVRLRDGTAIPQIPSYVHRRGRSFGWICQTLEGAMHLLITRALDPHSPEADGIVRDYEDNLYLSNQYGYTIDDFDKHWFDRGGMSMQACLLFDVEPYLYRDDVKHALRALFNAEAVSYFPDVRMNTEHAAPYFDDWRGDHYKSSDESNCAGWLRQLFIREEGDELLLGQAVPRDWLKPGQTCGLERAATYFGPASVLYSAGNNEITARVNGPQRNPPKQIRLRFRAPNERPLVSVRVNGKPWKQFQGDWVELPGNIGLAEVQASWRP